MAELEFHLDKTVGDGPLYLQLANQIIQGVERGRFPPGERLFTENELMQRTGLSRGTVKAAYSYLQERGVVRKIRGSGVYVQRRVDVGQSPQQTMEALLDLLTGTHGLTVAQAARLICQVTAQQFTQQRPLQVTLTDCSVEILHVIQKQLEQIPGIVVRALPLEEILLKGDTLLTDQCDLVLTTQLHFPSIQCYTQPLDIPTYPFALRPTGETLETLAKLPQGQRVCAIYRRSPFVDSIRYLLHTARVQLELVAVAEGDAEQLEHYVCSGLPFFLPCDYLTHSSNPTLQYVYRARATGSAIIPIGFEIAPESMEQLMALVKTMYARKRGAEV